MPELLPLDLDAINRSAVGAVDVFHIKGAIDILENGVVATDGQIIKNDMVIGPASERNMVPVKNDFTDSHAIK